VNWEPEDIARLREYNAKTKLRLRVYLQTRIPRVDGKTIEEVALQAKYKEGFESALRELDDLAVSPDDKDDPSAGNFITM
jgi:hypothetical protein